MNIEIGVIRQIDDGGLIGRGMICQRQRIFRIQRKGHRHMQSAGVVLLPIRADIIKPHRGGQPLRQHRIFPDLFIKTHSAAVEMTAFVLLIAAQLNGLTLQHEFPAGDPVADTSHRRPDIGTVGILVPVDPIVPQNNILVTENKALYSGAVIQHGDSRTPHIFQGNPFNLPTIPQGAER